MVAVIFRMLDAMRIFDLIYVLTPNNAKTKTMSVHGAREPVRFRQVRLWRNRLDRALPDHRNGSPCSTSGSAASISVEANADAAHCNQEHAASTSLVARHRHHRGLPVLLRDPDELQSRHRPVSGQLLADLDLARQLHGGADDRQLHPQPRQFAARRLPSSVAASLLLAVTASFALARVHFRGRALLMLTILVGLDVPADRRAGRPVRADPLIGIFNTPFALIFSYMIFTLPFTVWVLTTFMRDLPIEIEEAAIVDGASPGSSSRRCSCR